MPLYERDGFRIYFIHIPKCGGTSVKSLLENNGWKRIPEPEYFPTNKGHEVYEVWKNWKLAIESSFIFTVVRNPYSKLVSHMNMWLEIYYFSVESMKVVEMANGSIEFDREFFLNYFEKAGVDARDADGKVYSIKEIPFEDAYYLVQQYQDIINSENFPLEEQTKIRDDFIAKSFLEIHGKNLVEMSQEELISYFYDHQLSLEQPDHHPSYSHVSPDTKIYKIEDKFVDLLRDLKDKNMISENSFIPHENRQKVNFIEPLEFISAELKKTLKENYKKDFDNFEYSLED